MCLTKDCNFQQVALMRSGVFIKKKKKQWTLECIWNEFRKIPFCLLCHSQVLPGDSKAPTGWAGSPFFSSLEVSNPWAVSLLWLIHRMNGMGPLPHPEQMGCQAEEYSVELGLTPKESCPFYLPWFMATQTDHLRQLGSQNYSVWKMC